MATVHDYDLSEHRTRLLLGDPVAQAYAWIEAYAANLSDAEADPEDNYGSSGLITAEDLITIGLTHWPDGDGNKASWGDILSRGGLLEGTGTDPTFWEKLRVFSELEIPDDEVNQGSFFSCSC